MTREQAKQLESNPVWRGWRDEGKVIQYRQCGGDWVDCPEPTIENMLNYPSRYRLKPEPRRWWIRVYADGKVGAAFNEDEVEAARANGHVGTLVEVVEVLK